MLNPLWFLLLAGDGDAAVSSPAATTARWAQGPLRRALWVRSVKLNPTPIVEPGQGEDPT